MYHKSLDYRIHQNERIIKKRSKIAKTWGYDEYVKEPGRLRKYNLTCGNGTTSLSHPEGLRKRIPSYKEINQIKAMEEQIIESVQTA